MCVRLRSISGTALGSLKCEKKNVVLEQARGVRTAISIILLPSAKTPCAQTV